MKGPVGGMSESGETASRSRFTNHFLRIHSGSSRLGQISQILGFKIALGRHVQLRITGVILSLCWPHRMHHVPPKHSAIKTKARAWWQATNRKKTKSHIRTLTFYQIWSFCSYYKCAELHSIHINELYKIQLREKNWQFAFECKVLLLSFCFIKHHDIKPHGRTEGSVGNIQ
jgi:hypothetical protein